MKEKINSVLFVGFLFAFFILSLIIPDTYISSQERRKMAQAPSLSASSILNKSAMQQFNNYVQDQFPFRYTFKELDSYFKLDMLRKSDIDNMYIYDGYVIKQEYPLNLKSVEMYIAKVNEICDKYCKNNKIYHTVVPDKNYYVNNGEHLKMDYGNLLNKVQNEILDAKYIDITNELDLNCYYKTDIHWKQESIFKVRNKILKEMEMPEISSKYIVKEYSPFYGSYFGNFMLSTIQTDTIKYYTNDTIKNSVTKNVERDGEYKIYDETRLQDDIDKYSLFLSGPTPLITIYNSKCNSNKELIIFRDSFASSLVPLIIEDYSKITMVDIRYMSTDRAMKYIENDGADILFIYSATVINNSSILK